MKHKDKGSLTFSKGANSFASAFYAYMVPCVCIIYSNSIDLLFIASRKCLSTPLSLRSTLPVFSLLVIYSARDITPPEILRSAH